MSRLLRILCCIPCETQHSEVKRSNLATLREVLLYLYELDNTEQLLVNSFIRQVLTELSGTTYPHGSSTSLVDRRSLDTLRLRIKSRRHTSSIVSAPDTNGSRASIGWRRPSNLDCSSPASPIQSNVLSYFTPTQLELLLHLDFVKHWVRYTEMSHLGNTSYIDLPAMLPKPCTMFQPGRVRIASWNLNRFTLDKARHPGFRERVCLTILRSQISLILLQEVASLDVANALCLELNSPSLPHVRQWVSHHASSYVPQWDVATSIQPTGTMFRGKEYSLFLYNKHAGIQIRRTSLLEPPATDRENKIFSRSPCYALCSLRSFRAILVSVHLKARGLRNSAIGRTTTEVEKLESLVQAFKDTQPGGSYLIIAGDFNLHAGHESFSGLRNHGFFPILGDSRATATSAFARSTSSEIPNQSDTAYDNAWLSPLLAKKEDPLSCGHLSYTGDAGVISVDLRHPLIPNDSGAGANGFVSDHCPIWFDLNVP